MEIKKTPLYQEHLKQGAKMVNFAGWSMPISYSQLIEEHLHVRQHVGLFDVSHMGEVRVQGEKALDTLQWLTTNDVSKISQGQAQYSLLPNFQGGLVDDIIVYCMIHNRDYLVCVNAANKDKDFAWMKENNKGAEITDESDHWAQIAVQGPQAIRVCEKLFNLDLSAMPPFNFISFSYKGSAAILATTGYTGEKGCEVFIEKNRAADLWIDLLKSEVASVKPIGLGARDTLRTEMKYSLYGHEINDTSNPFEAGLGWAIKPAAKDFINKEKILAYQKNPTRKLIGFTMIDKGIPRENYPIMDPTTKEVIGHVTSGTHSPSLGEPVGIGYVPTRLAQLGQEILIDIRGRAAKAVVAKTPFVKTSLSQ